MSLDPSATVSTCAALLKHSGRYWALVSLAGAYWVRVGTDEYDTEDEAMQVAESTLRAMLHSMGIQPFQLGADTRSDCPNGRCPDPPRGFSPENN